MRDRSAFFIEVVAGLVILAVFCAFVLPRGHALGLRRRRSACAARASSSSLVALTAAALVADRGRHRGHRRSAFFAGLALNRLVPAPQPAHGADRVRRRCSADPLLPALDRDAHRPGGVHGGSCPRDRALSLAIVFVGKLTAALLSGRLLGLARPQVRCCSACRSHRPRRRSRPSRSASTSGSSTRPPERDARRRARHRARLEHRDAQRHPPDRSSARPGRAARRDGLRSDRRRRRSGGRRASPRDSRWRRAEPCSSARSRRPPASSSTRRGAVRRRPRRSLSAMGAEAESIVRVDTSATAGLAAIVAEHGVTLVVTGWHRAAVAADVLLGGQNDRPRGGRRRSGASQSLQAQSACDRVVLALDSTDLSERRAVERDLAIAVASVAAPPRGARASSSRADESAAREVAVSSATARSSWWTPARGETPLRPSRAPRISSSCRPGPAARRCLPTPPSSPRSRSAARSQFPRGRTRRRVSSPAHRRSSGGGLPDPGPAPARGRRRSGPASRRQREKDHTAGSDAERRERAPAPAGAPAIPTGRGSRRGCSPVWTVRGTVRRALRSRRRRRTTAHSPTRPRRGRAAAASKRRPTSP